MSENEQAEETEEAADAAEDAQDDESTGIRDGDFVELHYTVRTTGDDDVVDTTRQDVAEDAGLDHEGHEFDSRTVVVGAGHVFPGVDEALTGSETGDEGTVEVPAAEAFGEYDPDDVRTVAAEKIDEDDRYPGAQVAVDQQQGYIETIVGGRARVDFNHPLAGEDVEYEYEVVDVVTDDEAKAEGLLGMTLQQVPEVRVETETVEEEVTVEADADDEDAEPETEVRETERRSLYVDATPQMQMNQQWMFQKQQIAQDLIDRLDLDRVVVEEVIDGSGAGPMGGIMGGMGGMGGAAEDLEEELEDVDVDADEIVDELEDIEE